MQRVLVAYSGDRASSHVISRLIASRDADVVALIADVGQGRALEDIRDRALSLGAARAHVLDIRDVFARDFLLPALQAGALDDPHAAAAGALARAAIAKHAVEIARIESADAIAHGASKANAAPFARLLGDLAPDLRVVAAADAPESRAAAAPEIAGAKAGSANLWSRVIDVVAADSMREPEEDSYALTRAADDAPGIAAHVEIEFSAGVPVGINGVSMSLVELLQSLETIAGAHGVGRLLQLDGPPHAGRRRVVEAPAAVVLHAAHRDLQRAVTPAELARVSANISLEYVSVIEDGGWFGATRDALDAFVSRVQQRVTGVARVKLFKGDARVVAVHTAETREACKL